MSTSRAENLDLRLSSINQDAFHIYELTVQLQKKVTLEEEKRSLAEIIQANLDMMKKLKALEGNIDLCLKVLDDMATDLHKKVNVLEENKLSLQEEKAILKNNLTEEKDTLKPEVIALKNQVKLLEYRLSTLEWELASYRQEKNEAKQADNLFLYYTLNKSNCLIVLTVFS